jgi:bacteriocin biosynthesis cyclodehydratase domain-containing protein
MPRKPRVPGVIPVLRRADTEIQIGLDPRHAVVVGDLPERVADAACQLDDRADTEQLLGRTPPADRAAFRALLSELASRGLLADEPNPSRPVPPRLTADATTWRLRTGIDGARLIAARRDSAVVVHGDGRLAVAIATMLASAGVGRIDVATAGTVGPDDLGCGFLESDIGASRAGAARAAVRRCQPSVRTDPIPLPSADLVVLTDALVPAPELVASLLVEAVPHLAVRVREGTGIVGPLVLAGRSSCLGCADLRRAELDACWPTVAAQLAGAAQVADLACTQAAAAFATEQALRALAWLWFGGPQPPTWDATIEVDAFRGTIGHRPWSPHPRCPCGALMPDGSAT